MLMTVLELSAGPEAIAGQRWYGMEVFPVNAKAHTESAPMREVGLRAAGIYIGMLIGSSLFLRYFFEDSIL